MPNERSEAFRLPHKYLQDCQRSYGPVSSRFQLDSYQQTQKKVLAKYNLFGRASHGL